MTPGTREVPAGTPVESVIAWHTVQRAVWVAPLVIVAFALLRGVDGAVGASIGVAVVVGNFLLAGAMLSLAIRISLAMYHAAALFGFVLRLGLLIGLMFLIVQFLDIDRVAFGISAVLAYIVLVSLEFVAVGRGRERDLDWIS